ncbi:MAG: hypothetical protein V1679_00500 [Candidatus Peregrinibacteria bacterium]
MTQTKVEAWDGTERRQTKNLSPQEKAAADADFLYKEAQEYYGRKIVTVAEVVDIDYRDRTGEEQEFLRKATAHIIRNPEQIEIDERLVALVVDPINALSEAQRMVNGKVRSGEEVARAIPDVAAFLAEVNLQQKAGILLDFFELNESGQLVMKDECKEAYGLGKNALQARMRQTRIVYKEDGQTKVMTGEEYFNVTKRDGKSRPLEMELSQVAKEIDPRSILMARGLPTLKHDGNKHVEEYARMNTGQLEKETYTWTDDDSLDCSRARNAYWFDYDESVDSAVRNSRDRNGSLGSRGVLRVNLNLES